MAKYRRSFRIEKELSSVRKRVAKLDTVENDANKRKVDIQREFSDVSRKVGLLKRSCCISLEKENRIGQEILHCCDKAGYFRGTLTGQ